MAQEEREEIPVRPLRVFPNPASTVINFELRRQGPGPCQLQIFSFLGRKMYDHHVPAGRTVINLHDFYRGIYIYQLRDRNGRLVDSGKFQIAR